MPKIEPLNDNVLIKVFKKEEKAEKTKSGIIIPTSEKEQLTNKGEVIEVGEGRLLQDGKHAPLKVKKGNHVIFNSFAGTTILLNEEEYLILKSNDILAIIK